MDEFKQISTTMVWKLKKEWNINDKEKISDVKKLYYGLFNSNQIIIAFICLSIKNNEIFFTIHERKTTQNRTSKILKYLIKKAFVLKIFRLKCNFEEENQTIYKQFGFRKRYNSKCAKQLFLLNLKK